MAISVVGVAAHRPIPPWIGAKIGNQHASLAAGGSLDEAAHRAKSAASSSKGGMRTLRVQTSRSTLSLFRRNRRRVICESAARTQMTESEIRDAALFIGLGLKAPRAAGPRQACAKGASPQRKMAPAGA